MYTVVLYVNSTVFVSLLGVNAAGHALNKLSSPVMQMLFIHKDKCT